MEDYNTLIILGATATGKTHYAVQEALKLKGEIISADSRQVYKGLDIGTGKDLHEYGNVPYHLIDIRELGDEYNVFAFQKDVYSIFPKIISHSSFPIIAGGTPLYIDSIVKAYVMPEVPVDLSFREECKDWSLEDLQTFLLKYKKEVHNKTDLNERKRLIRAIEIAKFIRNNPECVEVAKNSRPNIKPRIVGIHFEKEELEKRIYERLIARVDAGMIEEVEELHNNGIEWEYLEGLGLEYRFTSQFLQGKIEGKEEYISALFRSICCFAKRQKTWFRKMERNGIKIEWKVKS